MNDRPGALPERRRHVRTDSKGTAIIRADRLALHGRIANVGRGGLFVAACVDLPESWNGRPVDVELRLDAGFARWVQGTGRIVRISNDGVAIAFDALPAELGEVIDQLGTASRARARVLSVVLIDSHAQRRSAMAAGFRGAGCAVIEAATQLEAIVRLGESSFEPDVIAIADSQPATSADEMRSFVQRNHPGAKLVTIGDAVLEPDGIAHWLSSADPEGDLPDRVREILVQPRPVTRS